MNRTALLLTALLAAATTLEAQDIRYETDEQCGCDIVYIDGIETTKEVLPDGEIRYGFRRDDGTVIAENIYKFVDQFHDGYCKVWLDDTLCGLIDTAGRQTVPCIYRAVDHPSCNRIWVSNGSLCGYTDLHGRIVIPLQYPISGTFSEGRANVAIAVDTFFLQCTYIDTSGNILFPPLYQTTMPYNDGYAPVRRYDRWGMIDLQGNEVLPTVYEHLSTSDHGTFFAGDSLGMALFDFGMKPLTPFIYQPVTTVSDQRIGVMRNDKYGFLDLQGNEVISCVFDEIGRFSLGRTMVRMGNKYGIIDTSGRTILPIEYDNRYRKSTKYTYHDSLALVEKDRKFGFVDLEGNIVIPLIFSDAHPFNQGYAPVCHQGRWGYIDTAGDIYLPFIFDIALPFLHGRAEIIYNGETRNIDIRGRCVKNCKGIIAFRDLDQTPRK